MTRYYLLAPDVAGGLGPGTDLSHSPEPFTVRRLEYRFDDWDGDDIVTSMLFFVVTDQLEAGIRAAQLTGAAFEDLLISKSEIYRQLRGDQALPRFRWMKVVGHEVVDDFWIASDGDLPRLAVSERAYEVLRGFSLRHCEIKEVSVQ